jgi:hypothetical protein
LKNIVVLSINSLILQTDYITGRERTADHYSRSMIGKKLLAEKQGFQPEKAGKVMTADHHDRELWERYFKL